MRRHRTQLRFAQIAPVVVLAVGAGLSAAIKLRAARRARRRPSRDLVGAERHVVEPFVEPSEDGGRTPSDGGLSLVGPAGGVSSDATSEMPVSLAGANLPPTEDASRSSRRGARGATTSTVLEALAKGGVMTAAEVALATGLGRPTVSSTLSRLVRLGAIAKAERGYQLPEVTAVSPPRTSKRASKTVATGTRSKRAMSTPTSPPRRRGASSAAVAAVPAPASGATKAKVLAALSTDVGLTAGEVATATGLGRGTVSTTLSRLAKRGEVVKAERGYRLP
jgi:DNA-binding transcriptional ArsR family regulator